MPSFQYVFGSNGPSPSDTQRRARETFERLADHLFDQGAFTLRQLQHQATGDSQRLKLLLDAGILQQAPSGELRLTAAGLHACEERTLLELFQTAGAGQIGWHDGGGRGHGPAPTGESRPHVPGDPLDHVDLHATLDNALHRGLPLHLCEDDVVVRESESGGSCASVLLLDLSGSMVRHGKFTAAKRAALALRALVRRRFPGDEFHAAGFATRAVPLVGSALLEAVPRDVGLFDLRQASLRVANSATEAPEHFTNIQAGLRLARRRLRSQRRINKQVLLITDGEPTAHLDGDDLVLAYPTTEETLRRTLEEARRCASEGIVLSVFSLVEEVSPPGLRPFVERLAWAGRGNVICCSARHLGRRLLNCFARARTGRGGRS